MSYKALYRTYRPSSFDDVVGQKHIVVTLQNAVKQNKIAHAYLFCGPRGTGKTSIAKLLAKAVNCEDAEHAPCGKCESCLSIQKGNHPDIVEIDAASNNGVDEIRDLIEKVKYSPIEGRYKVYIIDEVHMLSTGAFNALLKTLEEPPSHVLFVLATTEPHKVLPTIISRCQRYDFTKVENDEIIRRIHLILEQENIQCEDEAIRLIATLADGGMRDALSILDQCIAYAQDYITSTHVNEIYGITTIAEKLEMLDYVFNHDARSILGKIKLWSEKGIDIRRLTSDLIEIMKESVIFGYTKDSTLMTKLTVPEAEQILTQLNPKQLLELIQILMETTEKYRTASNVSSYFEISILKMIATLNGITIESETKQQEMSRPIVQPTIRTESVKEEISKIEVPSPMSEQTSVLETNHEFDEPETEALVVEEFDQEPENFDEDIPALIVEEPEVELVIQEVKIKKNIEPDALNMDTILRLMVQGDRNIRIIDDEKWKNIESKCRDLSCARQANLLRDTTVHVSGETFILIATEYQALANEILECKEDIEIFLDEQLGIDKVLFVTTEQQIALAKEEYLQRRNNHTLPPALTVEKKVKTLAQQEENKDKVMTEMISLFGDDFEIVEEENDK